MSRRTVSGGVSASTGRSKAPAAICEATSPAWAPPIPSATANTGAPAKYESSLALRCRPVSVLYACSAIVSISRQFEAQLGVADPDAVAGAQLGLAMELLGVEQGPVRR